MALQMKAHMRYENEDLTAFIKYSQLEDTRDWLLSPMPAGRENRDALHLYQVATMVSPSLTGFQQNVVKWWYTTVCLTRVRQVDEAELRQHAHAIHRLQAIGSAYIQVKEPRVHQLLGFEGDGNPKLIFRCNDSTRPGVSPTTYQAGILQLAPIPFRDFNTMEVANFPFARSREDVAIYHEEYTARNRSSVQQFGIPASPTDLVFNNSVRPRARSTPAHYAVRANLASPPSRSTPPPPAISWGHVLTTNYTPEEPTGASSSQPTAGHTPGTGLSSAGAANIFTGAPPTSSEGRGRPTGSRPAARSKSFHSSTPMAPPAGPAPRSRSQSSGAKKRSAPPTAGSSRANAVRPRLILPKPPAKSSQKQGGSDRPVSPTNEHRWYEMTRDPSPQPGPSHAAPAGDLPPPTGTTANNTIQLSDTDPDLPELIPIGPRANTSSDSEIFESEPESDEVVEISPGPRPNISVYTLSSDSSIASVHYQASLVVPAPHPAETDPAVVVAIQNDPRLPENAIPAFQWPAIQGDPTRPETASPAAPESIPPADPENLMLVWSSSDSSGSGTSNPPPLSDSSGNSGPDSSGPDSSMSIGTNSTRSLPENPGPSLRALYHALRGERGRHDTADSAVHSASSQDSSEAASRPNIRAQLLAQHLGRFNVSPNDPQRSGSQSQFNSSDDQALAEVSARAEHEAELDAAAGVCDRELAALQAASPANLSTGSTTLQILHDMAIIQDSPDKTLDDTNDGSLEEGEIRPERGTGN